MSSKTKTAAFAINLKYGDIVAALIAAVKEFSLRIEAEAAGIIASGPFFADVLEISIIADREDRDAVMQSVARVHESAVTGNEDLGAEVASCKAWRKR